MAGNSSYSAPRYSLQTNELQTTQRLIQGITSNIQKIAQNVNQIESMNMQIGTMKDSELLRDKLLQTENYTNQLAKDTTKQLKDLNSYVRSSSSSSEDRQIKIQKERLTNDLVKTLNKFQEVQKLAMQKQKESNERAKANMNFNQSNEESFRLQMIQPNNNPLGNGTGGTNSGTGYDMTNSFNDDLFDMQAPKQAGASSFQPHQPQQTQLLMESEVNLTQLREREAALRKLENDITDVNMIFKDLAVMVHDQGEIIDSIESNVEQVQISVGEANNHLESARKSQQKARKKKFICISILGSVALVVLLIIILSLAPWRSS